MDNNNDGDSHDSCCICLESLFATDTVLGVTVPCGHAVHQFCFQGWEKSQKSRHDDYGRRSHVSCPTCKHDKVKFQRIFISQPTTCDVDDDSDSDDDEEEEEDGSVQSIPDVEILDDEENVQEERGRGEEEDRVNDNNEQHYAGEGDVQPGLFCGNCLSDDNECVCPEVDDDDGGQVVDLTSSPLLASHHKKKRSSPKRKAKKKRDKTSKNQDDDNNSTTSSLEEKYKRQKRKLKRYKQFKSKYEECAVKQRELHKVHREMRDEVKHYKDSYHRDQLDLEEHRLAVICLTNKLDSTQTKLEHSERKRITFEQKCADQRVEFNKKLEQQRESLENVRNVLVLEQRKILDQEYPALLKENKALKLEMEDKEKYWKTYKQHIKNMEPQVKELLDRKMQENAPKNARQLKQELKLMNEFREQQKHEPVLPPGANAKKRKLEQEHRTKHVASARALQRVAAVGATKPSASSSSSGKRVLDDLFGNSRHSQLSRKSQSSKGTHHADCGVLGVPKATFPSVEYPCREFEQKDQEETVESSREVYRPVFSLSRAQPPFKSTVDRRLGSFSKKKSGGGNADIRAFAFRK